MNDTPNSPKDDQIIDPKPVSSPDDTGSTSDTIQTTQDQPVDVPADSTQNPIAQPKQDFGQIEVQQYDTPVKRPLASLEETLGERSDDQDSLPGQPEQPQEKQVVNFRPAANPPLKATSENRGVVIATTIAIIVLVVGFGAGWGGFKFFQGQVTSADTASDKTSESPKTIDTENGTTTTPATENSKTSNWTSYSNTLNKYSLKYPDTWYSVGTESATSTTIQLTSFKPDATATAITTGQKIEIVFQDTNGKTLTDWIAANNAAMGAKVDSTKKTTVDTKEASQVAYLTPLKSISTFLIHNDKVMNISYYAAEADYEKGLTIYEDIINSIKLNP